MKNHAIRIAPFGGFDIPGLERWLAEMAGKGLRYSTTLGPFPLFDRAEPEQVQVHLEPIQGKVEENPELNALYQSFGWQHWGMFRGDFFVYASQDLQAQAHTDPDILDYALKRFFRWKLLGGLLLALFNFLLLGLYHNGATWNVDWTWFRYFPVETLSDGVTLPFFLALAGLGLMDLAYLLGLVHLARYRRAVKQGTPARGQRGIGWLTTAGMLVLLPVLVNTLQLYAGQGYSPYDLEGSGFVTLTEIEGEDFRLSGNLMYNMDYISHGGTLLDPESWYFQQYAGGLDLNDVPRLEIRAVRYPLERLAQLRAEEWTRMHTNGSSDFQDLGAV